MHRPDTEDEKCAMIAKAVVDIALASKAPTKESMNRDINRFMIQLFPDIRPDNPNLERVVNKIVKELELNHIKTCEENAELQ